MNKILLIPIVLMLVSISCMILMLNIRTGNFVANFAYVFMFFPLLSLMQLVITFLFVKNVKATNRIPITLFIVNTLVVTLFILLTLNHIYRIS
jgi:hypothetical protein